MAGAVYIVFLTSVQVRTRLLSTERKVVGFLNQVFR
jgi:hypothetical protein